MTKHPFWKAPYLAFFSRDFYNTVLGSWRGLALTYLLFFLALIWVINVLQFNPVLTELKQTFVLPVVEQMPRLEFDNAKMSTSAETPYVIELEGSAVVIVDPDANSDALAGLPEGGLLLTRDAFFIKQFDGQVRQNPWVEGIDYIDSVRLASWLGVLEGWVRGLIYPFGVLGSFVYRFVEALLLAFVALGIGSVLKLSIAYAQAVRLTVVAISVAVVVQTFLAVVGLSVPFGWFVSFVIVVIYQYFGLSSFAAVSEDDTEAMM